MADENIFSPEEEEQMLPQDLRKALFEKAYPRRNDKHDMVREQYKRLSSKVDPQDSL